MQEIFVKVANKAAIKTASAASLGYSRILFLGGSSQQGAADVRMEGIVGNF